MHYEYDWERKRRAKRKKEKRGRFVIGDVGGESLTVGL